MNTLTQMDWIEIHQTDGNDKNTSKRKYTPKKYTKKQKIKTKIKHKNESECKIQIKNRPFWFDDSGTVEAWEKIIAWPKEPKTSKCKKCTIVNKCRRCRHNFFKFKY